MNRQCFLTRCKKKNVSVGGEWRHPLISDGEVYRGRKGRPHIWVWNQRLSSATSSAVFGCHILWDTSHSRVYFGCQCRHRWGFLALPLPCDQICVKTIPLPGGTWIPLKWKDWAIMEMTVLCYRTLQMHCGKGTGKSAQPALRCTGNWPRLLPAG